MLKKKYTYKYNKKLIFDIFKKIKITNQAVSNDYHRSISFVEMAFKEYEDKQIIERVKFAFLIPMRISRNSNDYWEDVIDFIPILKYLDLKDSYKVMISLPPTRIEFYGRRGEEPSGVVIMAPVFGDMVHDYRNKYFLLRKLRTRVQDTVNYAMDSYGASYIGLGGMLPKITNYGKTIKTKPDVFVTTGHAGTTSLILMIFKDIIRRSNAKHVTVGFLGGGSIGRAAMTNISKEYKDFKYMLFDKRESVNIRNRNILRGDGVDVSIARDNKHLLQESDIIISAITKKIDITNIDLKGKIIIDDSQPGSFEKKAIERLGGKLVWVVGSDLNRLEYATRRNGFCYGPYGLLRNRDVWGCEAELAVIAHYNKYTHAVSGEVTSRDIKQITELFNKYGIGLAEYQAFGKKSNIK